MESANLAAMFAVSEAEATAIRDAFNEGGELSAVVEPQRWQTVRTRGSN
jgi:hypothetical protein